MPVKVLVVGCGNMGKSHAKAYHSMEGFEIVGLVSRGEKSRQDLIEILSHDYPQFSDYAEALEQTKPDAVSINTYPDTHAEYTKKAFAAGAHVFLEKPIAESVEEAQEIVAAAREANLKLVIGYILRVHPSWMKFIEVAQGLGKPLVMRMNLNQQSSGKNWETHKCLMNSMSPIVDCGVHYVDVMCQMTRSKPVRVSAIGARLSEELNEGMYNYGQLQVSFEDGSVGWYEAGWGPMMSEVAFFVKDVVGPKGCVNIAGMKEGEETDDVDAHSKAESIKLHHSELDENGEFSKPDEIIDCADEPDHDGLCYREQEVFLNAITDDVDLSDHMDDAVNSLRIVLAADEAFKTGKTVEL
ncbi:MAG: gfo/Idh/MocA family oxidoreductase [Verrucomicrobia bacterium]|nr:MAG: oxidoreductase [Verrucomicrobiaceae bacterium TMED76]RCL30080.1 MAG: gfo/Idh/MocA family oxidoreductase [Verrucomicrobiota bacterium]